MKFSKVPTVHSWPEGEGVAMSKRAAAVQLTSDNYEEDDKNCDEVRLAFSTCFFGWALFSVTST